MAKRFFIQIVGEAEDPQKLQGKAREFVGGLDAKITTALLQADGKIAHLKEPEGSGQATQPSGKIVGVKPGLGA